MTANSPRQSSIDPVSLEIQWNRLVTVMDETDFAVVRTSFSTIVGESRDFACILLDPQGRSLAQSRFSSPAFTVTLPVTVKAILKRFPIEQIRPGDVLMTNDPWIGSGHLPDFSIATPVFHRGRLIAFIGTVAHISDIGGQPGFFGAREVFEEGLRLMPVKIWSQGEPVEEVLEIIGANVRVPDMVLGDVHAIVGAQRLGAERLIEFMADYGLEDLESLGAEIHARSEGAMRRGIATIPDGTYRHEIQIDGYLRPVTIRVAVTVRGEEIEVDYTGTSMEFTDTTINCPYTTSFADTYYPLKSSLAPDVYNNEGLFRPLTMKAPEGCIINARFPRAVRSRSKVSFHIHNAIYGALAQAMPGLVQAGSGSFWGIVASGTEADGTSFRGHYLPNGGKGATARADGLPTVAFPYNGTATPAEVWENVTPVLVERRELLPDSGGAGRLRGGLGQRLTLRTLPPEADGSAAEVQVALRPDKVKFPPPGVLGGADGGIGRYFFEDGEVPDVEGTFPLPPGRRLILEMPGGGGLGPPAERDPSALRQDVALGYVSKSAAKEGYGVDVDAG